MEEVAAGLNDSSAFDVIMGVVYGITALVLIITSYILFTRRFRKQKMEAVNKLEFITSRYNIYKENSQFLFNVPFKMHILLNLLNESDEVIEVLVDSEFEEGEHVYDFKVDSFPNGHYFLQLKADNVDMLRKISVQHG